MVRGAHVRACPAARRSRPWRVRHYRVSSTGDPPGSSAWPIVVGTPLAAGGPLGTAQVGALLVGIVATRPDALHPPMAITARCGGCDWAGGATAVSGGAASIAWAVVAAPAMAADEDAAISCASADVSGGCGGGAGGCGDNVCCCCCCGGGGWPTGCAVGGPPVDGVGGVATMAACEGAAAPWGGTGVRATPVVAVMVGTMPPLWVAIE